MSDRRPPSEAPPPFVHSTPPPPKSPPPGGRALWTRRLAMIAAVVGTSVLAATFVIRGDRSPGQPMPPPFVDATPIVDDGSVADVWVEYDGCTAYYHVNTCKTEANGVCVVDLCLDGGDGSMAADVPWFPPTDAGDGGSGDATVDASDASDAADADDGDADDADLDASEDADAGDGDAGGDPTSCSPTRPGDPYVENVNVRTGCERFVASFGSIGNPMTSFAIDIVFDPSLFPPDFVKYTEQGTDVPPYLTQGWSTTDAFIVPNGFRYVRKPGKFVAEVVKPDPKVPAKVGYVLHTPYGAKTYDVPAMLNGTLNPSNHVFGYRTEPFDGTVLEDRRSDGFYRITDLTTGVDRFYKIETNVDFALLARVDVSVLRDETRFFDPRSISIVRHATERHVQEIKSVVDVVETRVARFSRSLSSIPHPDYDWKSRLVSVYHTPSKAYFSLYSPWWGRGAADGGTSNVPDGGTPSEFRPENYSFTGITTQVGGTSGNDSMKVTYSGDRLSTATTTIQSEQSRVSTVTYARGDGPRVSRVTRSELLGRELLGSEEVLFESCDAKGKAFAGVTVSMPGDLRHQVEFNSAGLVAAETDPTGVRTEYTYSANAPRLEVTDVRIQTPGGDAPPGKHYDWDLATDKGWDASKWGLPVLRRVVDLPSQAVLAQFSDYDMRFLLPTRTVDERGFVTTLSYLPDGSVRSSTSQGLTKTFAIANWTGATHLRNGVVFGNVTATHSGAPLAPSVKLGERTIDASGRVFRVSLTSAKIPPTAELAPAGLIGFETEKRFVVADWVGGPNTVETWGDIIGSNGKPNRGPIAKLVVSSDATLQGASTSTAEVGGKAAGSLKGGTNDGNGTQVGAWTFDGFFNPAASIQKFVDSVGLKEISVNKVGVQRAVGRPAIGSGIGATTYLTANGRAQVKEVATHAFLPTTKVCK
ncbi:MAG: hypothetical protein U0169_25650 [Polyangiaceae bacterium]